MSAKKRSVAKLESNYMRQYDAHVVRHKRKKKRLYRRLLLFTVIVLVTFISITTYQLKQRSLYESKKEQYEQLQKEMTSLKEEEKDFKEEIELLQDEEYVLEIARTNYFFSKEGELIFKLPDEDPSY
ncbi:septum formation initiator family protein [Aquibacillus sp. 3ASR75-11]|uniref:Septum formation initiator family protein n=1 Tax=Terrihalobacillus insolitus TaxID=2950438 RepID=A0A9X3WXI6_9BACI|nr:septum formation initiator family protein [Terrihalobacillus insolitus]MDC3414857.1 septum formation initiator family protein [Terrihalobacillus insolitus]MDC3426006.1 septum formation initiator family protein [Terrihalobacillus insolitus]